ncbi:MAG: type IV secretion system protein [Clostridia bacterium]|nr:type IV secretion system protein [Clostridia bacterium]
MENYSNVTSTILETINTILGNLFSSIDNNVYTVLDDITFISSDIIYDSYFEKILGTSASNGILLISNSLIFGFILYYSIKYLLAHFTYKQTESPMQFIFKAIIFGICINFSYFFIGIILDLTSNITLAIRGIGEELFNKNICFSQLILEINNTISVGSFSLDVFSLDGLIKASLTMSLLNLVFTYSFRYIMVKIFILLTPFAILTLMLDSTSWFFKSWLKNLFSLLFIQIIVSIVLLILFSMDYSSNNLMTKFIYVGAIYALIKSNSFVRDFVGGVSTTFTQNVENLFRK